MVKKKTFLATVLVCVFLLLCACGKSPEEQWQEQYDLGQKYLSETNYEQALSSVNTSIDIDPNRPEAFVLRADIRVAMAQAAEEPANKEENYQLAREDYEHATSMMELTWELFEKLTAVYQEQDDSDALDALMQTATDSFKNDERWNKWLEENHYVVNENGTVDSEDVSGEAPKEMITPEEINVDEVVEELTNKVDDMQWIDGPIGFYFIGEEEKKTRYTPVLTALTTAGQQAEAAGNTGLAVKYYEPTAWMYYSMGDLANAYSIRQKLYSLTGDESYSVQGTEFYEEFSGIYFKYNSYGEMEHSYYWDPTDLISRWVSRYYSYDEFGRPVGIEVEVQLAGEYIINTWIDFSYDAKGRIQKITYRGEWEGTVDYQYDEIGSTVTETIYYPNNTNHYAEDKYVFGGVYKNIYTINKYGVRLEVTAGIPVVSGIVPTH